MPLLDPNQPSRIAILTAAARAYTSHEPDPTVRNPDWLADPLLSPDELALLDNHPMSRAVNQDYRIAAIDPDVSGLARPLLVATRYVDDRLNRALRDGITQFVILSAGFDSRPYRLRPLFLGKKVIELDHAATQQLKRRRVETVLGAPPPFLSYLEIDLARAGSPDGLAAVLRPIAKQKTFFIWESASMHHREAVVQATLRAMALAGPGSLLVMDFVAMSQVEKVNRDPASPQVRWDASWGEPWVFGVPDGRQESFFGDAGWKSREFLETGGAEATRRYLVRRDGTVFGPPPGAPGTGSEDYHARVLIELGV